MRTPASAATGRGHGRYSSPSSSSLSSVASATPISPWSPLPHACSTPSDERANEQLSPQATASSGAGAVTAPRSRRNRASAAAAAAASTFVSGVAGGGASGASGAGAWAIPAPTKAFWGIGLAPIWGNEKAGGGRSRGERWRKARRGMCHAATASCCAAALSRKTCAFAAIVGSALEVTPRWEAEIVPSACRWAAAGGGAAAAAAAAAFRKSISLSFASGGAKSSACSVAAAPGGSSSWPSAHARAVSSTARPPRDLRAMACHAASGARGSGGGEVALAAAARWRCASAPPPPPAPPPTGRPR